MSEMTVNGISVCPTGEERYEYFDLIPRSRKRNRYCQYDYRHTDGELFSCVVPTLDKCREKRNKWLANLYKKQKAYCGCTVPQNCPGNYITS